MDTIKDELQDYLSKNYPDTKLDTEQSLAGLITIRFNSTENESAETQERINQGVERATLIWHKLFEITSYPIWVVAYKYSGEQLFEFDTTYFLQQFSTTNSFLSGKETLNRGILGYDKNGNEVLDKAKGRIIIGKDLPQNINIKAILLGIANRDNGIEPAINQSVYFLNPVNHTGFHMYDDRGFFVWADDANKIKALYHTYHDWIPDYAKEDIDSYFV